MKDAEDEAFEDIERRQGGFQAKRQMAANKAQDETDMLTAIRPCRSCNGTGDRDTGIPESPIATCKPCNGTGQIALAQPSQLAHILQFMKELRPAIGPMATMGKSKTTQKWFDIVINEIERLQAAQEKNT